MKSLGYHVLLLFIDMYAAVFAVAAIISRVHVVPFVVPLLETRPRARVYLHVSHVLERHLIRPTTILYRCLWCLTHRPDSLNRRQHKIATAALPCLRRSGTDRSLAFNSVPLKLTKYLEVRQNECEERGIRNMQVQGCHTGILFAVAG